MELVHFYTRIVINDGQGHEISIKSMYKWPWQSQIEITSQFSDDNNPSTADVTIHGLSSETSDYVKKDGHVDIYCGWYNSNNTEQKISHFRSGMIKTVQPNYNSGSDISTQFTMQDGTSYDNIKKIKIKTTKEVRLKASGKSGLQNARHEMASYRASQDAAYKSWEKAQRAGGKHIPRSVSNAKRREMKKNIVAKQEKLGLAQSQKNSTKAKQVAKQKKVVYKNMNFKPKTKALTIINKIAKKAGIKIHRIELAKNVTYKNGYNANKKPMICIKQIAKDCGSTVYYPHGFLEIGKIKKVSLDYVASTKTGLLQQPQPQSDSDGTGTYQINMLFNAKITTGVSFTVDSATLKGKVTVLSGSSSITTGSTPTTECIVKK